MKNDEQTIVKLAKRYEWERYKNRLVLPNYAKLQRLRVYSILLTSFIFINLIAIFLFPIPKYISCTAVVLNGRLDNHHELIMPVILFLPEDYVKKVAKNQAIVIWLDGGESVDKKVLISDVGLLSRTRAQSEFSLTTDIVNNIPTRSVVVFTDLMPLPATISSAALQGRMFRASVMVGSEQLLTLMARYLGLN